MIAILIAAVLIGGAVLYIKQKKAKDSAAKNAAASPAVAAQPVAAVPVASPAPAPAPAPAVAAPPPQVVVAAPVQPAALPDGVLAIRGNAVKLAAVESLRASLPDPLCAQLAEWYIVQDASPDTFETRANLNDAKRALIGGFGVSDPNRWNAQHFQQAFQALVPAGTMQYGVGPQYPDVLSCIGDNYDAAGNLVYRSPRVANFPELLANCLADLAAARARNEPDVRLIGCLPIINHTIGHGVVA